MNYNKIYSTLIERSRNRSLTGYTERHHILPKCLGGSDDISNLAILTPEEHYLAHQLLVKIYPKNINLIYALSMLSGAKAGIKRNNKLYGWIKRKLSDARKNVPKSEEHKQKLRDANLGKVLSEATCLKMGESKISNTNGRGNKGKSKPIRTEEHIKNLSKALQKPKSEEGRKNIKAGSIKRSIKSILDKKDLYISFYEMYDNKNSRSEIKKTLGIKERAYYTIINKRSTIENIIKEYTDAL